MSEPQSKTELLIYRNSYKKHKERLNDIRHNITANNFHLPPKRPQDKKGDLRHKSRQEQITYENGMLKDKINNIKQRQMPEPIHLSQTENLKVPVRYDEDVKIDSMELDDGETVRCVLPAHKHRAYLAPPRPQLTSYYSQKQPHQTHRKRPLSFHKTDRNQRTQSQQAPREEQLYYHLPERNQQRQVINRKTVILSPTQSCLFELSLIGDRLLIAAHIMGLQSYCLTELLSSKFTKMLLKEYENNYEQFYPKIVLQQTNKRYNAIRINWKEPQVQRKISEQQIHKYKMKTQQNFIQRNYYTLLKKEEESKQEHDKSEKPTITHDKLQELMDRLAAPAKRYTIKGELPPPVVKNQKGNNQVRPVQQRKPIVIESKTSVHVDDKDVEERRNKMKGTAENSMVKNTGNKSSTERYVKPKEKPQNFMKLKQTQSQQYNSERPSVNNSFMQSNAHKFEQQNKSEEKKKETLNEEKKKETIKVQQEQDVEYLDGQNQQYKESFEELPEFSLKNKLESKKMDKSMKNQSKVSNKISEAQYQNESYEAMLESDVHPVAPKPQAAKAQEIEEQEYAQEFD